jgi:hypothetical protein
MTPSRRRLALGGALLVAAGLFAWAFWASMVPATHADHDHGILSLDAGGRLMVGSRDGSSRNLVGRPGKVLIIHFFSPEAPGAAAELAGLFAAQQRLKADPGVEFVLLAEAQDFASLDKWLAANQLVPPDPGTLYLDPDGETTKKLNCKRPLETMFYNPAGKLASQARGPEDWSGDAFARIQQARGGGTIE